MVDVSAEDNLISVLERFGFPVIRQGSLGAEETYPEMFFTFWNNQSFDGQHYDNEAHMIVSDFDVNIYATDPAAAYEKLREAKRLLKKHNFIITDSGHDVASDESTHIGRGMTVLFMESEE